MATEPELFWSKRISKKKIGQQIILASIPKKIRKRKPKDFSELY